MADIVKKAFNAKTQQVEDAVCTVDGNGELLFTFADGGFIKLPGNLSKEQIRERLEKHEQKNSGQISAEIFEKQKAENLDKLLNL